MRNFILNVLALINLSEGIIHVVVASISFWGMYELNVWDWRVAAAPATDLVLGFTSLLTAFFLRDVVQHHH